MEKSYQLNNSFTIIENTDVRDEIIKQCDKDREGRINSYKEPKTNRTPWKVGVTVIHKHFGKGRIISVTSDGWLEVQFVNSENKSFIRKISNADKIENITICK